VSLNRLTAGRLFNTFGGDDVCFVTMKGAKSGRTLTIPLMYVPYRDGLLLVPKQANTGALVAHEKKAKATVSLRTPFPFAASA
jgi:hypothetical protein